MASNFKAPPSLEKSTSYDAWLKEISIWETFTDIDIKKQEYTNLFSPNEYKKNDKIFSTIYCNVCNKYRKFKNPNISYNLKKKKKVFLLFTVSVVMNIKNI